MRWSIDNIDLLLVPLLASKDNFVPTMSETIVAEYGVDPFLILISCLLSLRTKDAVSLKASRKLFDLARSPEALLLIPEGRLEEIIYPVAFYKKRTKQLHKLCQVLITDYAGLVPESEQALLSLPGVGRKTMNLVRAMGFGIPALCVDTHVHRISNRLGLVDTKTPHETELELKRLLPEKYWSEFNTLIVKFGQNVCVSQSPHCSLCNISEYCQRIGVISSR